MSWGLDESHTKSLCAFSNNVDTVYNLYVSTLRGKKPILLPQRCREEAVVAACQSLLLPKPPLQEIPCSKHTTRPEEEEGSVNWSQGGSPTLICKDSLLFDEDIHPGPGTITVTYTNSYEPFRWQMLGSHSSHVFEKYFYYRKMLMLWAWKDHHHHHHQQQQQQNRKQIKISRDNQQSGSLSSTRPLFFHLEAHVSKVSKGKQKETKLQLSSHVLTSNMGLYYVCWDTRENIPLFIIWGKFRACRGVLKIKLVSVYEFHRALS